ncbi:DUF4838 domain-containing protein [Niveibacterium sp. SC-1]|uniref:DUF4838 domain-containing protein n=1 Tax=Niveibacterium sp. SC-1 TaxID=3135646 RepID=UPI00311D8F6F
MGFASLFLTTGFANAADPIVKNGGFESGAAPWWGASSNTVVTGAAAEGSSALRVSGGYTVQDRMAVTGGQRYRISLKVKAEDAPDDSVFVQLSYRGAAGLPTQWWGVGRVDFGTKTEPALLVTGNGPWRSYSLVVEAPALANQMLLYLRKKDGTAGAAYYDSVDVSPTSDAVTSASELRRIELAARYFAGALPNQPSGGAPGLVVQSSSTYMRVFAQRNADVVTLGAAGELAKYLGQISGASFLPLAADDTAGQWPLVIVGKEAAIARGAVAASAFNDLDGDGFILRRNGKDLVLAGATPRGTLNAVYWFLDRKLGVRWLAPDATRVPSLPTIQLAVTDERHVPRFAYREVLNTEGENKAFRAHNLLNGESHGYSFTPTTPELDVWDHSWSAKGGAANFYDLLPPATYQVSHPEWYPGGQVAMMNSGVRDLMAQAIVQKLRALPDYRQVWFYLDAMDWGWDMDAASQAFANAHGATAGAPRLDMANDIIRRVQTTLPGARLAFNAYQWSFAPPTDMTVSSDVTVVPMTVQIDYSTAMNVGRNVALGQGIARWSQMSSRVLVWDHITNFAGFIQPTPNIYPIGSSIRWLATLPNVIGYFGEGAWNTAGAEFSNLRLWMISRLLWNPELEARDLVADYCNAYYGAAAGPIMLRYIDLMHSTAASHSDIVGVRTTPDAAMYDLAFIRSADGLLNQAETAANGDAPALARVRAARMGVDYLALVRRQSYQEEAARSGSTWNADVSGRSQRLAATATASKLTQYRQGGGVAEMNAIVALERTASKPPAYVGGLAATDWAEIPDLAFWRFDTATLVADAAASDGVAARMSGASTAWAIQVRMDKLPAAGSWDVFADVRVEPEGTTPATEGLRVGTTPPMGLYNAVPASLVAGTSYQRVKLPGGPFRNEFNVQKGWYIQAPGGKTIRYVYVDRLIAVRAGLIQ